MNQALKTAADMIEAEMAALNVTRSVCSHCGVAKYDDFAAFQRHQELEAIVRKLRRFA